MLMMEAFNAAHEACLKDDAVKESFVCPGRGWLRRGRAILGIAGKRIGRGYAAARYSGHPFG